MIVVFLVMKLDAAALRRWRGRGMLADVRGAGKFGIGRFSGRVRRNQHPGTQDGGVALAGPEQALGLLGVAKGHRRLAVGGDQLGLGLQGGAPFAANQALLLQQHQGKGQQQHQHNGGSKAPLQFASNGLGAQRTRQKLKHYGSKVARRSSWALNLTPWRAAAVGLMRMCTLLLSCAWVASSTMPPAWAKPAISETVSAW